MNIGSKQIKASTKLRFSFPMLFQTEKPTVNFLNKLLNKYPSLVTFSIFSAIRNKYFNFNVSMCEICSKLKIKIPEQRHWRRSGFQFYLIFI